MTTSHISRHNGSSRRSKKLRALSKELSRLFWQDDLLANIRSLHPQPSLCSRVLAEIGRLPDLTTLLEHESRVTDHGRRIPLPAEAVTRPLANTAFINADQFTCASQARLLLQGSTVSSILNSRWDRLCEARRLGQLIWREYQAIQRFISPSSLVPQMTSILENPAFFSTIAPITRDPFMKFARTRTEEPRPAIRRDPQREPHPSRGSDIEWEKLRYLDYLVQQQIKELGISEEECIRRVINWISTQVPEGTDVQEADTSTPSPSRGQTTIRPAEFTPEDIDQYCFAVRSDGVKEMSRSEFKSILHIALEEYDLVVDGLAHRVYRRLRDGRMRNKKLTRLELALLVHAMRTQKPFAPRKVTHSANDKSAERLFISARAKADLHALKPDGSEYRRRFVAFEANRATYDSPMMVCFNPPAGLKWILLAPHED